MSLGAAGATVWVAVGGAGVFDGSGGCVAVNVSVGGTTVCVGVWVWVGVRKGVKVSDGVKEGVALAVAVIVPVGGRAVPVGGAFVNVTVGVKVFVGVRVGWLNQFCTCKVPNPRQ